MTTISLSNASAFEATSAAVATTVERDSIAKRLGRFACLCAVAIPITLAVAPADRPAETVTVSQTQGR